MTTLTAQRRDMNVKAKKLRREGFIPGIICGRDVKEQFTIQIDEKEAMRLIHETQQNKQVQLQIGDQKINTIIKDYSFNALKKQLEVVDFQALVKGEKIHTSAMVILKNEALAAGVVTQELSEVNYVADSDHLVDAIVIDFEKVKGLQTIKVSDLDAFKDPNVTVSNPDAIVCSVSEVTDMVDDADEDAETTEA